MRLDEPGGQLELTEREDGVIEVRAQVAVPLTLSWFWTKRWQRRGRAAAAGRITKFKGASKKVVRDELTPACDEWAEAQTRRVAHVWTKLLLVDQMHGAAVILGTPPPSTNL